MTAAATEAQEQRKFMHAKTPHLFDDATRITAGDSRWQGRTSPDYWAFVGPFGGFTAATILRALMEHPQIAGDPLAVTVNYCAPIAEGAFDLDLRLVKAVSTLGGHIFLGQRETVARLIADAAENGARVQALNQPSPSGGVSSPPPSARCISTTSTQRPCLNPTARITPATSKPQAR